MSHRALNPEQFNLEGLHPSLSGSAVPDVIEGRVARHVMHQAGIRQTREGVDAPHIAGTAEGYGNYGYRDEELWTSQSHLHMPTLRRYASGDIPSSEDVGEPDIDPDYEPETYYHGGKRWLAEGHHRTVATRLAR